MRKVKEPEASYVVDRNGRKKAVIIGLDEYERLIEDLSDLSALAARKKEKPVPWEQVKKRLKRDGLLLTRGQTFGGAGAERTSEGNYSQTQQGH